MYGRTGRAALGALAAFLLAACGAPDAGSVAGGGAGAAPAAATGAPPPTRSGTPELRVSAVAGGLSHVWDVGFLPDGRVAPALTVFPSGDAAPGRPGPSATGRVTWG